MNIDSIKNGIVIDHIQPGKAMLLYDMLKLGELDCSVAVIKNAPSSKTGKKDIIKIDEPIDFDMDLIGFVSPNATVNIIKDGETVEKRYLGLPKKLTGIVKCKNPRCITTTEQGIEHIFVLSSEEKTEYRCFYCDTKAE